MRRRGVFADKTVSGGSRAAALPGVLESVPTFRSLLVHYDPLVTSSAAIVQAVEDMVEDPRTRVPAGAVAIATNLTAIYTLESPGGWNLIGATPIRGFDARWTPPALLAPGDGVVFTPITAQEFGEIKAASEAGTYEVVCEDATP